MGKFYKNSSFWSSILAGAGIVYNLLFFGYQGAAEVTYNSGGPVSDSQQDDFQAAAMLNHQVSFSDEAYEGETWNFVVIDGSAALNPANPLIGVLPTREGLMIYKVQEGDTLSEIASNFGISLESIIWANSTLKPSFIKPGQEIIILPVSGVMHSVKGGEDLDSIAGTYGVDPEKIKELNPDFQKALQIAGSTLIIPDARPIKKVDYYSRYSGNFLNLDSYFIMPARGWNWGRLHEYNAVDIANGCGTPVYASAEGLVIDIGSSRAWNIGYGGYIKIEHPNSTKTLYAHTSENFVEVGDYVLQGDLIANMGNTGNTHGPSGCHLHFEVYGARNPFAK